jgi:hypothetical protein
LLTEQSRLRDAVARWSRLSHLADAEPYSSRARAALARVPVAPDAHDDEVVFAMIAPVHRTDDEPRVPVLTANVA